MLLGHIISALFPLRCAACDALIDHKAGAFCEICALSLTPLHDTTADVKVGTLRALAPDAYGAALADAIVRLKHGGRAETARVLAARISSRWPSPPVERAILVPIPLHALDLRARGYNQAALIAGRLARSWNTPVLDILRRTRRTGGQGGRDPAGRRAAVENAFELRRRGCRRAGDRPVLLVDDVLTTGATAREATRVLRRGGIEVAAIVAAAKAL